MATASDAQSHNGVSGSEVAYLLTKIPPVSTRAYAWLDQTFV